VLGQTALTFGKRTLTQTAFAVAIWPGFHALLRWVDLCGRQDERRRKLAPGDLEADQLGCASGGSGGVWLRHARASPGRAAPGGRWRRCL